LLFADVARILVLPSNVGRLAARMLLFRGSAACGNSGTYIGVSNEAIIDV